MALKIEVVYPSILVVQKLDLRYGRGVNTYKVYAGGDALTLERFTRFNLLSNNESLDLTVVTHTDDNFYYFEDLRIVNSMGVAVKQVLRQFKLPNDDK